MEEAQGATQAPKTLTKEERSRVASDAAKRRWAKTKRAAAKPVGKSKSAKTKKRQSSPREFVSALKMAEKRLVKAIQERAEYAAKYAVVSAEIPSLQRLILALKNPLGAAPEYGMPLPPSLEQIVGDQPLAYQNPARSPATVPVPQQLHPANTQNRAMGGAVGMELDEDENENKFLDESGVAGGQWH